MSYGILNGVYPQAGGDSPGIPYSQTEQGQSRLTYLNDQLNQLNGQNQVNTGLTNMFQGIENEGQKLFGSAGNIILIGLVGIGLFYLFDKDR